VIVFAMTCDELAREMNRRWGKGLHHAAALYREVFKKGNRSFFKAPEFVSSPSLARQVEKTVCWPSCRITARKKDNVLKWVSTLADGHCVESVLIPARSRNTLCVSSQVGCKMGCRFCVTGSMGFVRHLSAEEIVWQVHAARFQLKKPVHNVVFMGMGEPLDNFHEVMRAVDVMSDQRGLDISHRHITLSTAGHADGIQRLAALNRPNLRLAVSLNAASNELRNQIMPINRRYSLERLREELRAYPLGRDGVIFVEYVLLAGVNDSPEHAHELAEYLCGLSARVNVIACNGNGSPAFEAPQPDRVQKFCEWLAARRVFVRLRRSRGEKIMAGCGQLGASIMKGEGREKGGEAS